MSEKSVAIRGEMLKEARSRRGWSQEEVASQVDCAVRSIANAEAGKIGAKLGRQIAEALGLRFESLLRSDAGPLASLGGLMPPQPSLFFGRDDDIAAILRRYENAAEANERMVQSITAVRGWPGVGKTTLAAELLYQPIIKEIFPDGVLWTSLGPSPDLRRLLQQWSRAVSINTDDSATNEEISQRLAGHLAHRRVLLVVDDVWEAIHARPFQVGGPQCGMLLTTRSPRVAEDLTPSPAHRYLLDVLSDEDAIQLLENLSPRSVQASRAASLELVQTVEGLPLAIQVAGRLLEAEARYAPSAHRDAVRVKELIHDIQISAAKLLEETAPTDMSDLVAQTTPTVAALLRKSTDALSEEDRDRFAYLAAFASKPAMFRLSDLAAIWNVSENEAQTTIRVLADRGLLEPLDNGLYWVHALLVALAESLCTD